MAHVFGDLNDQLPKQVQKKLDVLMPSSSCSKADREKAMQSVADAVATAAPRALHQKAKAFCYVHHSFCHLHPQSEVLGHDELDDERSADHLSLSVNAAGHSCVAWSPRGSRAGQGHASSRPFAIWTAERRELREGLVIAECSSWFPPALLQDAVPGRQMLTFFVSPDMLGWPVHRSRVLNFLLDASKWQWVGPTDQEGYQALFQEVFSRHSRCDGDVFFSAPQSALQDYYKELLGTRKMCLQVASGHNKTKRFDTHFCKYYSCGDNDLHLCSWNNSNLLSSEACLHSLFALCCRRMPRLRNFSGHHWGQ